MRIFFLFASGRPVARHHLWKTSIKGLDAGGAGSGPGTRVASVRLPQGSCHLSALPDLGTRGSCHRRSPAVRAWAVRGLLGVSAGHSGSKTPCRPDALQAAPHPGGAPCGGEHGPLPRGLVVGAQEPHVDRGGAPRRQVAKPSRRVMRAGGCTAPQGGETPGVGLCKHGPRGPGADGRV